MRLADAMFKDRDNLAHRVKANGELTFAHKSGLRLATLNNKIVAIKSNGKTYDDWKPGCTGWKQHILTFIAEGNHTNKRAAVKTNLEARDRKAAARQLTEAVSGKPTPEAEAMATAGLNLIADVLGIEAEKVRPGKPGLQFELKRAWGLRAEIALTASTLEQTDFDKPELKDYLKKILNYGHQLYELL